MARLIAEAVGTTRDRRPGYRLSHSSSKTGISTVRSGGGTI